MNSESWNLVAPWENLLVRFQTLHTSTRWNSWFQNYTTFVLRDAVYAVILQVHVFRTSAGKRQLCKHDKQITPSLMSYVRWHPGHTCVSKSSCHTWGDIIEVIRVCSHCGHATWVHVIPSSTYLRTPDTEFSLRKKHVITRSSYVRIGDTKINLHEDRWY